MIFVKPALHTVPVAPQDVSGDAARVDPDSEGRGSAAKRPRVARRSEGEEASATR